jgi:3-hydroxyisobutyrate dehydrogenase/glyoxylate/succinic semialdehyde reductase
MKVGFIGLGAMGSRMAARLQKTGSRLAVFNRTRDKAEPLIREGATWADTPAVVAGQAEIVFTMLAHPAAVKEAALGQDGFLSRLPPRALWVDCSTVNPSFSREMAAEARARKLRFLDAPVAGSREPAARGELTIFVGGDAADLEACRPLLQAMGSKIVHVGGHGMGSALKMVNNLLLASSMAAFAEGLVLGEALGIQPERLLDVLLGSPLVAPYMAGKRNKMARGDYAPEFPMEWMQKDLHLAGVSAQETAVALPLAGAAKELYELAARQGHAKEDFSAIYAFLNARQS